MTQQLSATGLYSDDSSKDVTAQLTWASGNASIATVSTTGLVTAVASGTTSVSGSVGTVSETATVTVAAAAVTAVAVAPTTANLPLGRTVQLVAAAAYSDGTTSDVTQQATWTSGTPANVTVSATGLAAAAPSAPVGGASAVAAAFGGMNATATLTLAPAIIAALAVSPVTASIPLDRVQQLVATATYSDGTTRDVTRQATWTSGSPNNITVSPTGMAAPSVGATAFSTSILTAQIDGMSATSILVATLARPPLGPALGNDPLVAQQWHLKNTGQTGYADTPGIAGKDINAASTYQAGYSGSGVKVAVVDSGLEILHEDLAANVVAGSWNFVTATPDPTSTAIDGDHGTSVAGLIGMVYNNWFGGMGVAPGVSLNGYNLLASSQSLGYYLASLGASQANPKSADVWIFNQSYGTSQTFDSPVNPEMEAQYAWGVKSLRGGRGALYVKSAGNGFVGFGSAICSGAQGIGVSCQNASMDPNNTLPYNIVVGALNANGVKSSYSTTGSALWVSAPGGEYGENASVAGAGKAADNYMAAMVTTDQTGCGIGYSRSSVNTSVFANGNSPNGSCKYTNTFNGTSSAAPVTSGAIALILEANPTLTWRDVKHILAWTSSLVDVGIPAVTDATLVGGPYVVELPWTINAAGYLFHNWYGFGRVNVDAAVTMAKTYSYGQLGTLVDTGWVSSGALAMAIPDNNATGVTSTIDVPATPKNLVIEAVQISVSATHPYPGDLGIELTSPAGTKSILLNIRNGFQAPTGLDAGLDGMVLESNTFYGENSVGAWTVKVVDGWGGDTGTLTNWTIRVFGH
jgi:subtilisin-like proprotein convertase family protein